MGCKKWTRFNLQDSQRLISQWLCTCASWWGFSSVLSKGKKKKKKSRILTENPHTCQPDDLDLSRTFTLTSLGTRPGMRDYSDMDHRLLQDVWSTDSALMYGTWPDCPSVNSGWGMSMLYQHGLSSDETTALNGSPYFAESAANLKRAHWARWHLCTGRWGLWMLCTPNRAGSSLLIHHSNLE